MCLSKSSQPSRISASWPTALQVMYSVSDTARKRITMGTGQILNIKEVCGALGEFYFSNREGKKNL